MILDISRKETTGNRQQKEIIDNLWIRIDLIFDFWRCLFLSKKIRVVVHSNGKGSIGSVGIWGE
ncbi:MAG: hypothetical protein F6K48_11075 [Okeania sp. SIO3H1]|uniref:hypothetical protein n=1 Tax=Okeania sp. SIO1I7 TaxID=2607772 RepID=UPI0013CD68E3|nr:hypothetical protein [Okeania sp. SIO1I7]NEN89406.1 hypothetical protein [Okeania sp. SIO3H1]NET28551.1 hypothetical protein [Okeania sp. SIO1I7]